MPATAPSQTQRTPDRIGPMHDRLRSHEGLIMRMIKIIAVLAAATTVATGSQALADPRGTWLTAEGDAHIRVASCGAHTYCGSVAWLKSPLDPETGRPLLDRHNPDALKRGRPVVGTRILLGMRADGSRWAGHIYNSADGNTYEGNISVTSATVLRVEGCLMGFCQAQSWTRVK
jgi:uncharacterized protein (DUF2147 family)